MEQYSEKFSEKINEIKYELENKFVGTLSRRMIETVSNFHLCSEILTEYFINTFKNGKYKEDIEEFEEKSKDAIYELGVATWNKSLDYSPVIVSAFLETLFDFKIRDCRYGDVYLSAVKNDYYINYRMEKDKRGVSYNESTTNREMLWLLNLEANYSGILLNFGKEDILLLNKIKLCDKIKKKVEEYKINWNEEFYNSDYVDEKILAGLVKEHKIYVHKRSDGAFDKIVNYPQIQMIQENGYYEVESVEKVPMVRINIDSVNNLIKNFMKNDILCMVEPDIMHEKIVLMDRGRTMDEKSINFEKTIKEINRLLDLR